MEKSELDYGPLYSKEGKGPVEEAFYGGTYPEASPCLLPSNSDQGEDVILAKRKANAKKASMDACLYSSRSDLFRAPMTPAQVVDNHKNAFQRHVVAFNCWEWIDPSLSLEHLRAATDHFVAMHGFGKNVESDPSDKAVPPKS